MIGAQFFNAGDAFQQAQSVLEVSAPQESMFYGGAERSNIMDMNIDGEPDHAASGL